MAQNQAHNVVQSIPVYPAEAITVTSGANRGDAISIAPELQHDDIYELHADATPKRLSIVTDSDGALKVATDTALGMAGNMLFADCCVTLMASTGSTIDLVILVEVDTWGDIEAIYALPLAQLLPRMEYRVVGIDSETARTKLAEVACVAFSRGTRITLASGAQRPIEDIAVGDMVLTRDDGPRQVRWIGSSTMRAVGEFAPIRIHAGALHNAHDLLLSPEHRLFIYQRSDMLGAGRHEVLARARHLVNGDTVTQEDGGFIDYFQILFDEHQIIYAEGIAAETLLVDPSTSPALPAELSSKSAPPRPEQKARPHLAFEVAQSLLQHPDTAALLRRASTY